MEILQRALREALDRNAAETVRWTQYKEQQEQAKANIEEFKKSLEVEIMVPIGSKALMPGRLYHTNEIVVSHSGTYYSKCSAHKALEICQNRLNVAGSRLEALEAEANLHRNQLELPVDFDAFSSQEIIETYDEEVEKKWQLDHKRKVKEQKRKEAMERQKLMDGKGEDDVIRKLEELELMEELENELEAISEEDDEVLQAILNDRIEPSSEKKRISHCTEREENEQVASSIEDIGSLDSDSHRASNSDDDDDDNSDDVDDDIPAEIKELEHRTASMTNREKLKIFNAKLDEVRSYVLNMTPRTIEELSHKTDMMFLSDHLLSAIETIEDELKCERYLNGETGTSETNDQTMSPAIDTADLHKQTKTILKKNKRISFAAEDEVKSFDSREEPSKLFTKKISFAPEDEVKSFDSRDEPSKLFTKKISFASEVDLKSFDSREEPSKLSTKKISFALEDEVKSYDVLEEPIKISSTVIYDHGPVLNLNVVHSDAVFNETNDQSDVIRSPVDIYKQFAGCTRKESKKEQGSRVVRNVTVHSNSKAAAFLKNPPPEIKDESNDDSKEKTEVKQVLDNMFGTKNNNEPDPLPDGNFVDAHLPKKRISLFKQRRQMKSQ